MRRSARTEPHVIPDSPPAACYFPVRPPTPNAPNDNVVGSYVVMGSGWALGALRNQTWV
jgi:hypothetical protein